MEKKFKIGNRRDEKVIRLRKVGKKERGKIKKKKKQLAWNKIRKEKKGKKP